VSSPLTFQILRPESRQHSYRRDVANELTELTLESDSGRVRFSDNGMVTEDIGRETLTLRDGKPLSIMNEVRRTLLYERDDRRVRIETNSKMTCDASSF